MANTLTAKTTHNMMKAKQRTEFMEAGGYDGRFKAQSIPNKKTYKRKEKHRKDWA